MTDRVAEFCPVQCVEMEVSHTARVQLTAELCSDGRCDELARSGKLIETFEQVVQPMWNAGPARVGETTRRRVIGDRQDPGNDLRVDTGRRSFIAKAKETVRRKEELRDRAARARVHLSLQILQIGRAC